MNKTAPDSTTKRQRSFWDKFWRDDNGKVVIYRRPNWPIISWFIVTVLWLLGVAGKWSNILFGLGVALLALWAVLELWRGVTYFRKLLGGLVLLGLVLAARYIWLVFDLADGFENV